MMTDGVLSSGFKAIATCVVALNVSIQCHGTLTQECLRPAWDIAQELCRPNNLQVYNT